MKAKLLASCREGYISADDVLGLAVEQGISVPSATSFIGHIGFNVSLILSLNLSKLMKSNSKVCESGYSFRVVITKYLFWSGTKILV